MTLQEIKEEAEKRKQEATGEVIDDRAEVEAAAIKEATKTKLKNYKEAENKKILEQYDRTKNTTQYYINNLYDEDINNFKSATTSSGFKQFDEITGGIMPGLYIIGAAPSMGKTTFCLQLADQIAANNRKVIYFTLEQTRRELITKSLNRYTDDETTRDEIINDPETREKAIKKYTAAVGDNLQIIDGTKARNYSNIEEIIKCNLELNPVIFIDYLQIITPDKSKGNIKTDLDTIASKLEALAKNNDLTIIIISSFNRSNYYLPANFAAFKETGGIEYSADVLITLQLDIFENSYNDKDQAAIIQRAEEEKRKNPREMEAVILKSRSYGLKNIKLDYYADKDLFMEV